MKSPGGNASWAFLCGRICRVAKRTAWLENAPGGIASWAFFMSERAALTASHGTKTQAQRIQFDEALGIELVIGALVILKRHMLHGIEAIGRLPPGDDGIALVKLEPHRA